jgi:hypothetical protein
MKNAHYILLTILLSSLSFGAENRGSGRDGGNGEGQHRSANNRQIRTAQRSANQTRQQKVFPSYPNRTSNHGVRQSIPAHSDSIGNRVTSDHLDRVEFAHGRSESVMRNNVKVTETVHNVRNRFVTSYRPGFVTRSLAFNGYYDHYHAFAINHPIYFDAWHRHFFYGGFYYGFHPLLDIDLYFYNPMVYWFFVPHYDEYYYRTWYSSEYDAYPALHVPFAYHGLYFPTDNLKQLLFGVSAMPVDKQVQFRAAITVFTKEVAQSLANQTGQHVRLSNGDIVINHYEILGYDESISIEGFINSNNKAYDFKGLLDLQNPGKTSIFIPQSIEATPVEADLSRLDQMNQQIDEVKGKDSQNPVEAEVPATPAEINADPQK